MSYHIHQGDALAVLREMPSESVDCCITSPPYYGLRRYLKDGDPDAHKEIGQEPTPAAYIARLVEVFREVRRVLKAQGTLWVNVGDSYNGSGHKEPQINSPKQMTSGGATSQRGTMVPGLKPKDLIGIPWMLAFALRDDGWWLRSEIVWAKRAPMPESVRDRPTRAHEQIFLLAKSQRYYYDADAIAEPLARPDEGARQTPARFGGALKWEDAQKQSRLHSGNEYTGTSTGTRNKRDVWDLSPMACSDAHFATFPIELPETCLRAGCPEGGVVLDPFSGAGTTGLACLKNGRRFVGIELNPDYVQIAYNRARRHYPLLVEGAA